ncbi:MAG: hypothetical protein H6607_09505 [Flavobacteriales bacterium]|nr:hypothetical protein [Flavobacteriales bacterium]
MLSEILLPTTTWALTGGPSQPEVQSFEPAGTTQMVDLFSGDFNYNIPLLDVGGYPVNLSYHAGIGMDQEASWVGLGWNINAGAINRMKRGVPDDFMGESINRELNIKDNWTLGFNAGTSPEIFGWNAENSKFNIRFGMGLFYNSYKGWGTEVSVSPAFNIQKKNSTTSFGFDYSANSHSGIDISPSVSFTQKYEKDKQQHGSTFEIGSTFNSRAGLQEVGLSFSHASRQTHKSKSNSKFMGGGGQLAGMTFAQSTWMPSGSNSYGNAAVSFNFKPGTELWGLTLHTDFSGYYSNQWLRNKETNKKAYGYLYEEHKDDNLSDGGLEKLDVLLDFNREPEGILAKGSMNLPVTNHTYDIYSASGQGIAGAYRPMRSDIPALHDDYTQSGGGGGKLGADFGLGALIKAGVNGGWHYNKSTSGAWKEDNKLIYQGDFISSKENAQDIDYEPSFFASMGELSVADSQYFDIFNRTTLIEPNLTGGTVLGNLYKTNEGAYFRSPYTGNNNHVRTGRMPRNTHLSYLAGNDAVAAALERDIEIYPINGTPINGAFDVENVSRLSRPRHHLSEMSVTGTDGMRYIYGIPAYNNKDVSMTFNVAGNTVTQSDGQVSYTTTDASVNNNKGQDNYYEKIETPAYAHSYLLTAILSSDYVDLTGDGISDDDIGTAVKINYSRTSENYKWRVPYNELKASHGGGLKTNPDDDKGSVLYGEKEMWYMHSIESKNHIAVFKISTRQDGKGVEDIHGGMSSLENSYKLDKIILYSKQEYLSNPSTAVPIKTVHFEYDYSLCPGIDNSVTQGTGGKLTLKSVYFTYGSSEKGRTTPYTFVYSSNNPSYVLKGVDRWGNYSPLNTNLPNEEYPFTTQDKEDADNYAESWCLTKVFLPSGGTIDIQYEADDYAYVQDKKAMQMIKIAGFGRGSSIGTRSEHTYNEYDKEIDKHDILYFHLQEPITGANAKDELIKNYLKGIEIFQFTVYARLSKNHGPDPASPHEYVKGYAEIDWDRMDKFGVIQNGTIGYFPMKDGVAKRRKEKEQNVSPIALSIWNFTRMNTPYILYQGKAPKLDKDGDRTKKSFSMSPFQGDLFRILGGGMYKHMESEEIGKLVVLDKSWIRLNNPNGKKLGGGHRVKQISLSDNWDLMNTDDPNAESFAYGQTYSYTTEISDENGGTTEISSGVASYEPMLGSDENPYVMPRVLTIDNLWIPNDEYMMDNPIGESYFPSPSVGYSKVEVKALSHSGVERTATGRTVHEFNTAKDFPIVVESTELKPNVQAPKWKILQNWKMRTYFAGTQGHVIELNDMHGKPKAQWSYAEGGTNPISGVKYIYHTNKSGTKEKLENYVKTVDQKGEIKSRMIGVDIDFHNDFRQNRSESLDGSFNTNTDGFLFLVGIAAVITIFPGIKKKKNENYTAVSTKVINRKGLLKEVIAFQEGSQISTTNEIYDALTGEVLVTSVQNEFEDKIYNSAIPAYYAYDGMGHKYKNNELYVRKVLFTDGKPTLPFNLSVSDYLVEGDEVLIYPFQKDANGATIYAKNGYAQVRYHAWLYKGADGILNLIDREGNPIKLNTYADLKVIRSGRKNVPGAAVMTVESTSLPVASNKLAFSNVLNVSAMEFKDEWKTQLNYFTFEKCEDTETDFYTNIVALFQAMDGNASRFERKCEHNYHRPDPQNVAFFDESLSQSEIISTYYFEPCLVEYVGINPTSSIEFEKVNQAGQMMWQVTYTPKYDMLFQKDGNGNYIHVYEASSGNNLTGSTSASYLDDVFYVWDDNHQVYIPITFEEIKQNCAVNCYHETDYLSDLNSSLLSNIQQSSSIINVGANWKLDYNEESNSFEVIFSWTEEGLEPSCKVSIDLENHDLNNILEFLNFEVTSSHTMRVQTVVKDQYGDVDTIWLNVTSDCDPFLDCETVCGNGFTEATTNPFLRGIKGNWRPYKSWVFVSERDQNSSGVNTRTDGKLTDFNAFWKFSSSAQKYEPTYNDPKWVWSSEITKYSPFGQELENKNPLNQYSSAMYGYNHTLPTAVAANSQFSQMFFDGFEEYAFNELMAVEFPCPAAKIDINAIVLNSMDLSFDNTQQHTGNYSIKINPTTSMVCNVALSDFTVHTSSADENYTKIVKLTDDVGEFTPAEPGKYVVGAWVKEARDAYHTSYDEMYIEVVVTDQNNQLRTYTINTNGKLIEGWQRIEGQFEVMTGDKNLAITIYGASDVDGWLDDLRVHPFNSNMKSYVYDYRSLRLMAELDENNYATFYEYDNEGALLRVKKETEKGVATLQETRSHIKSNN